ncbi:MAG: helix-turn-helix domain-containing protein [Lachnospiraceae bacterium]|nr:helix-turn-helix domain-containing protein [Lachnospiraceae bacterium]
MQSETGRKILNILMDEREPVSARGLALRCDVSINTVRKEIGYINEEAASHGFQVESKTAMGCYLSVFNRKLAEPYLSESRYLYKRNRHIRSEYDQNIEYLLRRIISAASPVTLERLCDEMYCSHSTMNRYLDQVRKALTKYDLRLVNRRSAGFVVEGSEWNLRQCLLFLHKGYTLTPENTRKEYAFKTMFFMMDGMDWYARVRQILIRSLERQNDFYIPLLHIPKVVNYILLSVSRAKYIGNRYDFSEEQIAAVKGTGEYDFAKRLWQELPARIRDCMCEKDILGISMLLLSFETRNYALKGSAVYENLRQEILEFIHDPTADWYFDKVTLDETFLEDAVCFLYALQNRLLFHVYNDTEAVSLVSHRGLGTTDICISFVRFYERKHNVHLYETRDILSMFYLFQHQSKTAARGYCVQNALVVSRYGIHYAQSLADSIRRGYGREIKSITPREHGETREDDFFEYDLLITTDVKDPKQIIEFFSGEVPVLNVDLRLGTDQSPELDDYLEQVRHDREAPYLKNESFHYVNLASKQKVYQYLAHLFANEEISEQDLEKHMEENDRYGILEKENGVVMIPILMESMKEVKLQVLINYTPFIWKENRAWIIVCYVRTGGSEEFVIAGGILKRILHMGVGKLEELIYHPEKNPLEILYQK